MQLGSTFTRRPLRVYQGSAIAFAITVLLPMPLLADDSIRAGVTYFGEGSAKDAPVHVIHPQVRYSQDLGPRLGLDLGYDADIVSGATPQVFGSDVITGATEFKDTRHNGAGTLRFMSDFSTLSVGGGYAGENDYRSATLTVAASTELFERNTRFDLSYTHNFDKICDAANSQNQELIERNALSSSDNCFETSSVVTERDLAIDTIQATWTQVLNPWTLIQVGVTSQLLHGFQSNPYRQVQLGPQAVQEHVPDIRNRFAYFARGKFAIKPVRGAFELRARGYADSWAIESLTGEAAWDQYITRTLSFRIRGRYYLQDSALFYRDGNLYRQSGATGAYWTGDRELSALQNVTAGGKLTWRWRARDRSFLRIVDEITLSAKADLYFYTSRTETPSESPNFARTEDIIDALVVSANLGLAF